MPKKKASEFPQNAEEIALKGFQYYQGKQQISEIEKSLKETRKPLEAYLDAEGMDTPQGHKLVVVPYADKDVHLKRTRRSTAILRPEALDILKEMGLKDCIESVEVVRDDILSEMILRGELPDEVVQRLYEEKVSNAFSVDVKQRFSDDEDPH